MRINESAGFKFNIFNMKQDAVEASDNQLQTAPPETQGHSFSTRNMMSDSFVQNEREESRYINGLMTSYAIADQFRSQMQSVVDIYQVEAGLVAAASPDNYAEMMLVGMKAEEAAKEKAENFTGKKLEEKLEKDSKEQEEEDEKKEVEKIEEKLMPDGSKNILKADPDSEDLIKDIVEKAEKVTESSSYKILKGSEAQEWQEVAGSIQAAEQVSVLGAVSTVTLESDNKKAQPIDSKLQTVESGSSSLKAVPPPGTYVDEVV